MSKRYRLAALAVVAGLLAAAAFARPNKTTGAAHLHPIDHSGIRASVQFEDLGPVDGLKVVATATGLDPNAVYVSLVYDKRAKPAGPEPCLPSEDNNLSPLQMIVGEWTVAADGTGTLSVTKAGPFWVALGDIGAMSIRRFGQLQACGRVSLGARPNCAIPR